jgi:hypothetical protein
MTSTDALVMVCRSLFSINVVVVVVVVVVTAAAAAVVVVVSEASVSSVSNFHLLNLS